MKKDIPELKVENVAIAVVKETSPEGETIWNVYVLNLKDSPIENVLVASTGYGEIDGEQRRTSTLRHYIENLDAKSYFKIEPIMETLFGINNEYWLSFYQGKDIYDKKYVFLAESIKEENFTIVPLIQKKGVMIC